MNQQGYKPPQSESQTARDAWSKYSPTKKAALVLLLFLLLLFCGFVLNPTVGAWVFIAELVAGAVIGIRALKRRKAKHKARPALQVHEKPYQKPLETYQKSPLRDEITDLGYAHSVTDNSEYIRGIRVAGVAFKNSSRHRQTILRQIYWKDEPYSGSITVRLRETEYEGKPAIEVWTNDEQIGFIPQNLVPFIIERFDRAREIYDFRVSGGGKTDDGSTISYGASFSIAFNR